MICITVSHWVITVHFCVFTLSSTAFTMPYCCITMVYYAEIQLHCKITVLDITIIMLLCQNSVLLCHKLLCCSPHLLTVHNTMPYITSSVLCFAITVVTCAITLTCYTKTLPSSVSTMIYYNSLCCIVPWYYLSKLFFCSYEEIIWPKQLTKDRI